MRQNLFKTDPDGEMACFQNDMHLKEHVLSFSRRAYVMGILNITPDSFSDGAKYLDPVRAVDRALEMESQGADIIDIGGESSRPGALPVSEEDELSRVIPVLCELKKRCKAIISVDTSKSEVADRALKEGAEIINDITALNGDARMPGVIAAGEGAVCLMHMKGTPEDMQLEPVYKDVISEIIEYLSSSIKVAEDAGIDPGKIIVDPGVGFGKTKEHNLRILKKLSCFRILSKPVMIGTSRKSFIGEITGKPTGERVFGTAATVSAAVMAGADIVRVHDVAEMIDVTVMAEAIRGTE
jgi:dihydropteroate synthase